MKDNIRTYLAFYTGSKAKILLSFFLTLVQALSILPIAIIIKYLFDHSLLSGNNQEFIFGIITVLFLFIVNAVAILANRHITLSIIKSIISNMRQRLIQRSLFLDYSFFANEDLDKMHARIVQDTERLDVMTSAILTQLLPGIGIVVGLFALLLYLNPVLVVVMVIALPFLFIADRFMSGKMKRRIAIFHGHFNEFSKGIQFVLKFNELIVSSTAEKYEAERQKKNIENLEVSSRHMAWFSTAYATVQGNIILFGGMCVLFVGGLQVIQGSITIGALLSFYVTLDFLSNNARNILMVIPSLLEGKQSLQTLMPLVAEEGKGRREGGATFIHFSRDISFKDVSFDYGTDFRIKDASFSIPKGSITGIFGESGSGKSTLINLLLGYHTPKKGEILIDGVSLKDLDLVSYRQKVGVLSQEPMLFPGTIFENISYGIEGVSEEEMKKVCRECGIHDFISNLPEKYGTDIGNRGIKISGGQRQRIAIARALLRNPYILIMDEPDKNLNDSLMFEIVKNIKHRNITLVVISHNQGFRDHVTNSITVKDGLTYTEQHEK